MKKSEKVKKKIDEIMQARRDELDSIDTKIEESKVALDKAKSDMKEAENSCNEKAYSDAKARKRLASDAIEMYSNRRETITKKGLVTKEEYETMCSEVLEEIRQKSEDTKRKLYPLSESMVEIGNELQAEKNEAEELLLVLYRDIYPEGQVEEQVVNVGNKTQVNHLHHSPKHLDREIGEIIHWAKIPTTSLVYQEFQKTIASEPEEASGE